MHEPNLDGTRIDKPIVIAVAGEPLGVVVPHEEGFRFLAVKLPAFALEGRTFPTVETARRAASELVR